MIEFRNLTKYMIKPSLWTQPTTIESGKIIGLIGHNRAGKSATIKSLVVRYPSNKRRNYCGQAELSSIVLPLKKKLAVVQTYSYA